MSASSNEMNGSKRWLLPSTCIQDQSGIPNMFIHVTEKTMRTPWSEERQISPQILQRERTVIAET